MKQRKGKREVGGTGCEHSVGAAQSPLWRGSLLHSNPRKAAPLNSETEGAAFSDSCAFGLLVASNQKAPISLCSAKRGHAKRCADANAAPAFTHNGPWPNPETSQSIILLIGYSTMPFAPAAFNAGTADRTVLSSTIEFTAIQSGSERCDNVGVCSAGRILTTLSS